MIITVTLNPTMDKTVVLEELIIGETNRVKESRSDPGGKGINVSRVLRTLGKSSLAMGFVAGSVGRFVEASLNEIGILDDFIHTPGQTRTNIAIEDEKNETTTLINEKGPKIGAHYVQELKSRLNGHCKPGTWVVFGGSAPPGINSKIYAELIAEAKRCGGIAVLDADGDLLRSGVLAGAHLIKPNRVELEDLVGRELSTEEEVLGAAREVQASGVGIVVVSLGAKGAIAITDREAWKVVPPLVDARSTVGAGDSMLAGVVLQLMEGKGLDEALRLGAAAGAATALTPGTQLCYREDIDRLLPQVQVEKLALMPMGTH
ncbi:MAG: 1-phosphofructokinase [Chloroflexi bacterium]|nr:1-phosphofructokinase [Chloroflexota bacterium]